MRGFFVYVFLYICVVKVHKKLVSHLSKHVILTLDFETPWVKKPLCKPCD